MSEAYLIIAEDEENFRMIEEMALESCQPSVNFSFYKDGKEITEFLIECHEQSKPLPNCIILDLNMPRMNGWETIEWIQQQSYLKDIPVVILSGSTDSKDIARAEQIGVVYEQKPVPFDDYVELFQKIIEKILLKS